jgi:hypothetical protein
MSGSPTVSASKDELLGAKSDTSFKNDVIKEALRSYFTNTKTKISDDAVELMTELTKVLVVESSVRAAKQASLQNKNVVTLDHMESVLPQLVKAISKRPTKIILILFVSDVRLSINILFRTSPYHLNN